MVAAANWAPRPAPRPRAPPRPKTWWKWASKFKLWRGVGPWLALGVACAGGFGGAGDLLRGMGRGVMAAAALADDVASAAGTLVEVGANVTVTVSEAANSAYSASKSVADDFMSGVDLVEVDVFKGVVRIAAASPPDLANWVAAGGGGNVPAAVARASVGIIESVHRRLPLAEFHNDTFQEQGLFLRWHGRVRLLRSGYTALALEIAEIRFATQWSNGLWDLLELNPRLQHQRVLRSLDELLRDMPRSPANLFELTDEALDTSALPVLPKTYSGLTWSAIHGYVRLEPLVISLFCISAVAASFMGFTQPRLAAGLAFAGDDETGDDSEWAPVPAGDTTSPLDLSGSSLENYALAGDP